MEEMIGYCGIVCTECEAYIATKNNDDNLRKKIAEEWSKQFNTEIKSENVNCDGCLSEDGQLIGHCHVCEIRRCGQEKNVKNCAYCDEYSCEKLNEFHKMVPDAKGTLDELRKNS